MPTYYKEVQENQSSSHGGHFLAACVLASSLATAPQVPNTGTEVPFLRDEDIAVAAYQHEHEADRIVTRIIGLSQDEALRDEDEAPPPQIVIDQMITLIRAADAALLTMPHAQVSSFFGELNVTWRAGDRIVRLAAFPDRPSLLQTGSTLMPVGSFRSEPNPSPERLAEEITALVHDTYDPEGQTFLG